MTGTHAKLAPSAAARWIACPGSVRLSEGFEDVSSEASKEGTFAHEIAAECLDLGVDASFFIGHTGEVEGSEFTCDEEMAEHIQTYLDVCDGLNGTGVETYVETKVEYRPELYGTADFVAIKTFSDRPPRVDVVDLKFGKGVKVNANGNAQGRIYAIAACKTFGVVPSDVGIHIVQPRHPQGGHSCERLAYDHLLDWAQNDVARAMALTRHEDPPLQTGDHCKFCLAKAICPKMKEQFDDVFVDEGAPDVMRTPPAPETLTSEQLGHMLDVFPQVEEYMTAVRAYAKDRAQKGSPPKRYKLVQVTGHRKWNDPKKAEHKMVRAGHDPFAPRKLLSPAQAEKLIGKDAVSKMAHKPVTGVKLVPESDERPHYDAGLVFEDLGE